MRHDARKRRFRLMVAIAAEVALAAAVAVLPLPGGSAGSWAVHLLSPHADLMSVSCSAPGTCAAGGYITDARRDNRAFLVSEVGGRWQRPEPVPGLAALAAGGADPDSVTSVSCASAGTCTAVGYFYGGAFAVSEVRGTWQRATELLDVQGDSAGVAVSCPSAGTCTAIGNAYDLAGPVVATEIRGTWQPGTPVGGLSGLAGAYDSLVSVSVACASPGNCAVDGSFGDDGDGTETLPFVASEVGGIWQPGEVVPGSSASDYSYSTVSGVSCASPGTCAAGGYSRGHAYLVSDVGGTWQHLTDVPGLPGDDRAATANGSIDSQTTSVSCSAPGTCTAGGYAGGHAFVVSEVGGIWQRAAPVPGLSALGKGSSEITSVSCSAPGTCTAGGTYGKDDEQVFLASQVDGTWMRAVPVSAPAGVNPADVAAENGVQISCPVMNQRAASWYFLAALAAVITLPPHPARCGGIGNGLDFELSQNTP